MGPELNTSENPLEDDFRAIYSGAKRRIAALEQELVNLQNAGAKRKSCSSPQLYMFLESDILANRDLTSNITLGRVIPRLVSMFQSIDELVDENDRRCALEIDGIIDLGGYSLEYEFHVIS